MTVNMAMDAADSVVEVDSFWPGDEQGMLEEWKSVGVVKKLPEWLPMR